MPGPSWSQPRPLLALLVAAVGRGTELRVDEALQVGLGTLSHTVGERTLTPTPMPTSNKQGEASSLLA